MRMYGEGRNLRYFIGIGLVIILLFFVIFLIMRSGGDNKVPETARELTSYVDDSNFSVTLTTVGPITDATTHHEAQIIVTNQDASAEISQGYDGNIVASTSHALTNSGFGEFLSALEKAGYTRGNTTEDLKDDKGFCPTGQRYILEAHDGSKSVQRFWATSCGGTKTYKGNLGLTLDLFQSQIPDYGDLIDDKNL